MAKAIVCVGATNVFGAIPRIGYSASVIGPPTFSYASDYTVDTGISIAANLLAWRNKIIAEAAAKGVTLVASDVIVFGAPS